jgi:two-component system, LytTR family, response regulator
MSRIRILIVDDEPLARQGIRALLKNDQEVEIVGECANGRQALKTLKSEAIDLMFLDVQMPEMNGFEVLKAVPPGRMPIVIFVSAFDKFALKAFEAHALDYLLKSFSNKQFYVSLERAKTQFRLHALSSVAGRMAGLLNEYSTTPESRRRTEPLKDKPDEHLRRIPVTEAGSIRFVRTEDIDWIEAADNYVQIHAGAEVHVHRESLSRLESGLDPERFARIHRSTIVNIDRILKVEPLLGGNCLVTITGGQELSMSHRYKGRLKTLLKPRSPQR